MSMTHIVCDGLAPLEKLWEPDEISKNPNLSPHLDRAASWGGGIHIHDRLNGPKKEKQVGTSPNI